MLSSDLARFRLDGYLVVEDFINAEQIERLKGDAADVVEQFDPKECRSVFSTTNQGQTSDDWFLQSASNVSCFFEEGVLDEAGDLKVDKAQAINKIGHALHEFRAPFKEFAESDAVKAILVALGYEHPIAVQSMYIMKSARVGGVVSQHQDASFLRTDPHSVVGFWVALEDATVENGCLWAAPGSHTSGTVYKTFRRREGGRSEGTKGGACELVGDDIPEVASRTPLEVKAGTLVLLDGRLVHWSEENRSGKSRHAFSVHVVEGGKGVEWHASNWLQRTAACPFRALY